MATGGAKKPGSAEKPGGAVDPAALATGEWGPISIESNNPSIPEDWSTGIPLTPSVNFVVHKPLKVSEFRSGRYGESKGFGFFEADEPLSVSGKAPTVSSDPRGAHSLISGSAPFTFTSEQLAALGAAEVPPISPPAASHNTAMADQPTRAEIDAKLQLAAERTERLVGETSVKIDALIAAQAERDRAAAAAQALRDAAAADRDRAAVAAQAQRDAAAAERDAAAAALQAQRDAAAATHQARLDDQIKQVMASNSQLKTTIIGTGVAVVLGIAAFNATVLSNMVASFESGRNTAQAISELAKRVDESAKTVAEAASAAKAVERSADKSGEKSAEKRGGK